jgi:hypothetical protein
MDAASGRAEDLDATEMIDIDALASRAVRLTSKEDKSNKSHKRPVAIQGASPSGSLPGALEDTAGGVPEHKQGQDFVEAGMNVRDMPKLINDVPSPTNSAATTGPNKANDANDSDEFDMLHAHSA